MNTQYDYKTQVTKDFASDRCIAHLLNCYCREVSSPRKLFELSEIQSNPEAPLSLRASVKLQTAQLLTLTLPETNSLLMIAIESASLTGNYRYNSSPFLKRKGQPWRMIDWLELSTVIIQTLSAMYRQPFNAELLNQITNSYSVTEQIINAITTAKPWQEGAQAYEISEQSLTFGHAFHPTPKSREGFTKQHVLTFSPEIQSTFQLFYFSVHSHHVIQKYIGETSATSIINDFAPSLSLKKNHQLIPVHPWQAEYIQKIPLVRDAIKNGEICVLGLAGKPYVPTSSLRTVYHRSNPYFYKFSLHVRLTNCIRKNAIYELETAVFLTSLIKHEQKSIQAYFPDFHIMQEPAYLSVNLPAQNQKQQIQVTEAFGMLFREGIQSYYSATRTPLLAGALFSSRHKKDAKITEYLQQLGHTKDQSAKIWFRAYIENLILPIFYCYFERGIIFEPHLQNVLIVLEENLPKRVIIRDLEGTKLNRSNWQPERLKPLSEKEQASLYYSEEKGWNRIVYCLFINNLSEAVHYISGSNRVLERELWHEVRNVCTHYLKTHVNKNALRLVSRLLQSKTLPSKANLTTRFLKHTDKKATYIPLINPLRKVID